MTTFPAEYGAVAITANSMIQGAVYGDITILGGKNEIQGQVTGAVIARGGRTWIRGSVGSIILDGGEVHLATGSGVGGQLLERDGTWRPPRTEPPFDSDPHPNYLNAADVLPVREDA
ncbi:hypothetical protein [Microbacterium sp.]|uniref:hypothetical protein n=1 Tax=Microbacterium sp. TaxID=51671 RepID=UPI0035686A18